jgi:hypothetical protein
MDKLFARHILAVLCALLLSSCDSHDSDYIPYGLKGMDAYVYDNDADVEHYAGSVEGNYLSKDDTLSGCQSLAYSTARQKNLDDWGYVCCTVTSSSSCATKVR